MRPFTPRSSLLCSLPCLTGLLLLACGSAAVDQPGPAPVDPRIYQDAAPRAAVHQKTREEVARDERDLATKVLSGYARDDFQASIPLLDPEGNLSFPGLSEATDRVGDLKVLRDLFSAFSDRKFVVGRAWQPPHVAVLEWTMTGTQTGDWMAIRATNRPVTIRGLAIYWFDQDELVSDSHLFFDVGATLAELGAAPKGIEAPSSAIPSVSTDAVVAAGTEIEKHDVEIVNASWDAFEARKEAEYLTALAEDIEVFRLDRAAPEKGKAERKRFYKALSAGIGSFSQTPLNAWGVGNFVIEEYGITGVHSGRLFDIPASGHALRLHLVDIDELRDGKVVRTWTYGNSLELLAEAGQVAHAAPGATATVIQ